MFFLEDFRGIGEFVLCSVLLECLFFFLRFIENLFFVFVFGVFNGVFIEWGFVCVFEFFCNNLFVVFEFMDKIWMLLVVFFDLIEDFIFLVLRILMCFILGVVVWFFCLMILEILFVEFFIVLFDLLCFGVFFEGVVFLGFVVLILIDLIFWDFFEFVEIWIVFIVGRDGFLINIVLELCGILFGVRGLGLWLVFRWEGIGILIFKIEVKLCGSFFKFLRFVELYCILYLRLFDLIFVNCVWWIYFGVYKM